MPANRRCRRTSSNPASPPTHSEAASTCTARLVTAIWWLPAPAACPVNAGGTIAAIATTAVTAARPREVPPRLSTAAASARPVCSSSACPCETENAKLTTDGRPICPTGTASTSETVRTIRTAEPAAHNRASQVVRRSSHHPRAATLGPSPGSRNAAVTVRPTVRTPSRFTSRVTTGSPHSVPAPGLGIPGSTASSTAPPNRNAPTRTTTAATTGAIRTTRTVAQSVRPPLWFPA